MHRGHALGAWLVMTSAAMSFDMSGAGQAVSTRQTGELTGHYSIDGNGAGGGLHTGVNSPAD